MPKSKSLGRPKGKERFRSLASFERRPGQRQPRQCILIICEGIETEPLYFGSLRQELKLTLVEVEVEGKGATPITIVEHALARQDQRQQEVKRAQRKGQISPPLFDQIWCVFDVENLLDNPSFHQAVDKARAKNLELAVSNPAFEYWYLLHFKETSQPFSNAAELIRALKDKDCLPNYEKNLNICHLLFDRTDLAIERADRLLTNHPDLSSEFPNPSTLVFKLVRKLKEMAIR